MIYPQSGLLPKEETQSSLLCQDFNGSNTTIAILDTGVDPKAPGLQTTPSGKPKILDIVDCTGAGDVYLQPATVESTTIDGESVVCITGLTGKKLLLPTVVNPSGVFKRGIKNTKDLFPADLRSRLNKKKLNDFSIANHALVADTLTKQKKAGEGSAEQIEQHKVVLEKEEALKKDLLLNFQKEYKEVGTLFDIIVYNDGNTNRALIDLSATGDLRTFKPMAAFSEEFDSRSFGDDSLISFSLCFYDDEVVSIVTNAGAHGTHVASITSAYFPDNSGENGVAPGAQLFSMKIGDARLGSMETGQGLIRALTYLLKRKVDVINMSYGEATALPNNGRIVDLIKKIVDNGTVFCCSGGNAGPALTTVGAPGGTMDMAIGVGAYVSKGMMDSEYAMLKQTDERPYTWSSRGPTVDGDLGVDIYAPGAAITSVPRDTMQKSQLMNGTSMASPNLCGCVSLLISALKAKEVEYTPYLIKRALMNTCKDVGDPMQVGLVQVMEALKYLVDNSSIVTANLHYAVSIRGRGRGIYLRDLDESSVLQELPMNVTPVFIDKENVQQNHKKVDLELRIALKSSHDWIQVPEFFVSSSLGRDMNVRVDASKLDPGFHFGTIKAYDTQNEGVGVLFTVPVTVCKPISPSTHLQIRDLHFHPGDIKRNFVSVPPNANVCELIITTKGRLTPSIFYIHTVQLHPQTRYTVFEQKYRVAMLQDGSGPQTYKKTFPVLPNTTMEICLAQFWNSLDDSIANLEVNFHGILMSVGNNTQGSNGCSGNTGGSNLLITSGSSGFTRIDLATPLSRQSLSPKFSFDKVEKLLRPSDYKSGPLKSRDLLKDGKQLFQLVNTYKVKFDEPTSAYFKLPRFKQMLYDSNLDNFAIYVFDANNQDIYFQDVYGAERKYEAGDYTIKAQFVSSDLDLLKSLESSCLTVQIGLDASVTLPIYDQLVTIGKDKLGNIATKKGDRVTVWAGDFDKLPKSAKPGDILTGKADFGGDKIDGTLYTLAYVVPPEFKPKELDLTIKETEKEDSVKFAEAIRDLEIQWIGKMKKMDEKLKLAADLAVKYPESHELMKQTLAVYTEALDDENGLAAEKFESCLQFCKSVLGKVDQTKVAIYFGQKHQLTHEKDKNEKTSMELQREIIGQCYLILALVYQQASAQNVGFVGINVTEESEKNLDEYAKWTVTEADKDGAYVFLFAQKQKRLDLPATALDQVQKYLANTANKSKKVYKKVLKLKLDLLHDLGWKLWLDYENHLRLVNFPVVVSDF